MMSRRAAVNITEDESAALKEEVETRLGLTRTAGRTSKAEKLLIANNLATAERSRTKPPRKVMLVDADGMPVRVSNDVEVERGVRERFGIEFSTLPGSRPKVVNCDCGVPLSVPKRGRVPKACDNCRASAEAARLRVPTRCQDTTCDVHGGRPLVNTIAAVRMRAKSKVLLHRCRPCNGTMNLSAITPEERSRQSRLNIANTPRATLQERGRAHAHNLATFRVQIEPDSNVGRRIMSLHRNGFSASRIARVLIEEGLPTVHGGTWARSTVRQFIKRVGGLD